MRGFGYVAAVTGAFVFTFRDLVAEIEDRVVDPPALVLTLLFGFAAVAILAGVLLVLGQRRPTRAWEGLAVVAVPALVLLALFAPESGPAEGDPILYPILFNLLVAALALGAVVVGYYNDEVWLVNAGLAAVAIDIVARYFDFFWAMLPRSLAFIGVGMLILTLAFFLERHRSRLVARIEQ